MDGGQMETPARGMAQPGQEGRFATAAGFHKVTQPKPKRHKGGMAYTVTPSAGETFHIVVSGRVHWALDRLRKAGDVGCTPISEPAPRWAAYIHSLREMGVEVETITEPHNGDFPGHHARYVLRSGVSRSVEGGAA